MNMSDAGCWHLHPNSSQSSNFTPASTSSLFNFKSSTPFQHLLFASLVLSPFLFHQYHPRSFLLQVISLLVSASSACLIKSRFHAMISSSDSHFRMSSHLLSVDSPSNPPSVLLSLFHSWCSNRLLNKSLPTPIDFFPRDFLHGLGLTPDRIFGSLFVFSSFSLLTRPASHAAGLMFCRCYFL